MSSWTGNIADQEIARRSNYSSQIGDTDLAMGTSDLVTVALAQANAVVNANNTAVTHVSERFLGVNVARGFLVASNLGGTFGSTFAVLQASLPDNDNSNKALMING